MSSASDPTSSSVISQLTELVRGQGSPEAEPIPLSDLLGLGVAMFSLLGVACVRNLRNKENWDLLKVW